MSHPTDDPNENLLPGFEPVHAEEAISRAPTRIASDVRVAPQQEPTPNAETLPARMLNEFVYCRRLFYFEHVEGVFMHNADTLRGAAIHVKVDSGSGKMPAARRRKTGASADGGAEESGDVAEEPETIHSRSVQLGSERLGVVAKLDLVESRVTENADDLFAVETCPVDYKAGAPREEEEGNALWPTDRMQLGLQMMLLRDNGYHCSRGIIYYRATKQRVALDYTPELEAWILSNIAEARRVAASPHRPPPLVDSPKCVRCSLAPVCLPDETVRLKQAPTEGDAVPPRRLMAARDDTRALYLNTPGLHIGIRDRVLQVKEKEKKLEEIRLNDLHHVALFGNIQLSTQAIHQLCRAEIPVTWFSGGGWFYGHTVGHSLPNILLRRAQFRAADDPSLCLGLAREFVRGKIRNQRTLLMRNHVEAPAPVLAKMKNAIESAGNAASLEALLGVEGAAAAWYFGAFDGMLKTAPDLVEEEEAGVPEAGVSEEGSAFTFDFEKRNRRPPEDPVNAMLSLAYSVLSKDCAIALRAVGLDPGMGFYHQPRAGRPALALDLMEEFRPLIADSAVLATVNNRMVSTNDFVRAGRAVNLSPKGRKAFFQAYELRMNHVITHPVFDYKVSYRRALELQARLLARKLEGEIPDYIPLRTR